MQPAASTDPSGNDRSRQLRRLGPVVVVVVLLVVVGVVVATSGSDDTAEGDDPTGTGQGSPTTQAPGDLAGMTFSEADEQGIEVDWPATCDTEKGRVAVPSNFAAECVVPFEGDNGGATSPGVTDDTIRIVYYQSPPDPFVDLIFSVVNGDDTKEQAVQTLEGFNELYETYYETYGRRVELIPFTGSGSSLDEVTARADAVTIAEEYEPFMVWGGPFLTDAFSNELAARGIMNINLGGSMRSEYYVDNAPYLWSILMAPDQLQTHLAQYLGRRLAGRPAIHAGDEDLRDQERVFGRLYLEIGPDVDYLVGQFDEAMAAEGTEFAVSVPYSDPVTLPNVVAQKIAALKEAGVTTVVCICDPLAPADFTEEATNQEFFPEWIVTGSNVIDTTVFARTYDQEQWAHAFGPGSLGARGAPQATFAYYLYEWFHGAAPPADNGVTALFPYASLTYAGVQGAGPGLTPDSFRDGLFAAPPVPGGLTNPAVSFGDKGLWPVDDYVAIDDMTELWWDPEASGPDELGGAGSGLYQYVDGGVRYGPDEWPDAEPEVFDPDGAVAIYETLPPSDAAGDYPSPAGSADGPDSSDPP